MRKEDTPMEYTDRHGTNCAKWDGLQARFGDDSLLPMWIADMDFACPSCAVQALHQYVDAPLGYFLPPASYFDTVAQWEAVRHGYAVKPEWICVTPGIVPALHWAVRVFTKPGDGVMVSTPVYNPFMQAVQACGQRRLVCNKLRRTGMQYEFDFDAMERQMAGQNVTLYLLCNPHNPVGRVWTAEELRRLLSICRRHHVLVISDEIHQDIVNPSLGRGKVTAAALDDFGDRVITMASVSKTFNLAAVQNSFVIIENDALREKFRAFQRQMAVDEAGGFGFVAAQAAMQGGQAWLRDVLATIYGNYDDLRSRLRAECPQIGLSELEGTYLAWLDFSAVCADEAGLKAFLQRQCRLALNYGSWFGGEESALCVRMNLATSRENVQLACDRLAAALAHA